MSQDKSSSSIDSALSSLTVEVRIHVLRNADGSVSTAIVECIGVDGRVLSQTDVLEMIAEYETASALRDRCAEPWCSAKAPTPMASIVVCDPHR